MKRRSPMNPTRVPTPGAQETMQQIERRLQRQLRDQEAAKIRIADKEKAGPRTFNELKNDKVIGNIQKTRS